MKINCFPIDYNVKHVDKFNTYFVFFNKNGIKLTIISILMNLGLEKREYEIYEEYNIRYSGFDCYNMKEEDVKRFVKYINSIALLRKV